MTSPIQFRHYALFLLMAVYFVELPKIYCLMSDQPYHLMCFIHGMPVSNSSRKWIGSHIIISVLHITLLFLRISYQKRRHLLEKRFEMISNLVFAIWMVINAVNMNHLGPLHPMIACVLLLSINILLSWTWIYRDNIEAIYLHYTLFSLPVMGTFCIILVCIVKNYIF